MNKIIAIVNPKGGVGKTTTAVQLANSLTNKGYSVQLKDADPQASATMWIGMIEDYDEEVPFNFEITNRTRLSRNHDKYDFTIIDTPPADTAIIDEAIKCSDFIIIPTAPTTLDITRVFGITGACKEGSYAVLLTQADSRTKTYAFACEALKEEKIEMFETFIPHKEAIKRSVGTLDIEESYNTFADELLERLEK